MKNTHNKNSRSKRRNSRSKRRNSRSKRRNSRSKRRNSRSKRRNTRKQSGGSKKGYPEIIPADPERIRALIPNINTNQVIYAEPVPNAPPAQLLTQSIPQAAVLQRQATVPLLLDQVYPLQDIQGEGFWDKLELEGCIKRCIY